jgi:hypothetical protein
MGIGGLDTEFNEIFRRAFASRVFPPGLVEKLGIEHVKGIDYSELQYTPFNDFLLWQVFCYMDLQELERPSLPGKLGRC